MSDDAALDIYEKLLVQTFMGMFWTGTNLNAERYVKINYEIPSQCGQVTLSVDS